LLPSVASWTPTTRSASFQSPKSLWRTIKPRGYKTPLEVRQTWEDGRALVKTAA